MRAPPVVSALILSAALTLPSASPAAEGRVPVLGGPCEGCELVFVGMPDSLASVARIAPPGEVGEPLRIEGTVRDRRGRAAAGVIVYAYHTDAKGIYPTRGGPGVASRHGLLRGWARTDARGRYAFVTIRPAGYPNSDLPQHVHMHVIEPRRGTYWIDDLVFTDDPRLTASQRRSHTHGRGGSGVATPVRGDGGIWLARRDIVLGQGIGGYRE